MTLYVTLFVIFAGFAFTTTGAHPFPVKSVTPILMVVADIVTNLSVDYMKPNQIQQINNKKAANDKLFYSNLFDGLECDGIKYTADNLRLGLAGRRKLPPYT